MDSLIQTNIITITSQETPNVDMSDTCRFSKTFQIQVFCPFCKTIKKLRPFEVNTHFKKCQKTHVIDPEDANKYVLNLLDFSNELLWQYFKLHLENKWQDKYVLEYLLSIEDKNKKISKLKTLD